MGRGVWVLLFVSLLEVGCDRGSSIDEVRKRAELTVADAEAKANTLSTNWKQLVADVKAAAIVPELGTPCSANPRPKPAMRTLIAMSTGISSTAGESLLDRRIPAGSYYLTPHAQIDQSYSPNAATLRKLSKELQSALADPNVKTEELSGHIREIQRVKPAYEGLIVIDEVEAPKLTDQAKLLFQPGFAIGRAYLIDHGTGSAVCFSKAVAENSGTVKSGGGLNRAFLEMDLAKGLLESVGKHWVAARKR